MFFSKMYARRYYRRSFSGAGVWACWRLHAALMAHSTPYLSSLWSVRLSAKKKRKKIQHASKRPDGLSNLVHDVVGGSPHVNPQQERHLEKGLRPAWSALLEDNMSLNRGSDAHVFRLEQMEHMKMSSFSFPSAVRSFLFCSNTFVVGLTEMSLRPFPVWRWDAFSLSRSQVDSSKQKWSWMATSDLISALHSIC